MSTKQRDHDWLKKEIFTVEISGLTWGHFASVSGGDAEIEVRGRHDPCIVPRAVPVVECLTAFVLLDLLLWAESAAVAHGGQART